MKRQGGEGGRFATRIMWRRGAAEVKTEKKIQSCATGSSQAKMSLMTLPFANSEVKEKQWRKGDQNLKRAKRKKTSKRRGGGRGGRVDDEEKKGLCNSKGGLKKGAGNFRFAMGRTQ